MNSTFKYLFCDKIDILVHTNSGMDLKKQQLKINPEMEWNKHE